MELIYFDNSATTKPYRNVIDEMAECMENNYGNPSSAHGLGILAERKLKKARQQVARLVNASEQEILFTSCGSEANNMAIKGMLKKNDHYITTAIEHPSIRNINESLVQQGIEVTVLKVDNNGIIDIEELKNAIKPNTRLISIMYVNNEVGSIEPIKEITSIAKEMNRRVKVHVDGVQALGKIKIDVKELNIDLLTLSGHKIHGPKGIGALFIKKGTDIKPLIDGGGQESDLRSGTENLPGIAGFGLAAEMIMNSLSKNLTHIKELKAYFIDRLDELEGIHINSPADEQHIPYILSVSFENVRGEVLLHALEDYKIYVSTGSACSAKKSVHKNYVLPAIGLDDKLADGTIRFSFSEFNTLNEVDKTIDALRQILGMLRRLKK